MAASDPATHETNPQTYLREMRDTFKRLSPEGQQRFVDKHTEAGWPKISEAAITKNGLPPVGTLPPIKEFLDELYAEENPFGSNEDGEGGFTSSVAFRSLMAQRRELGLTDDEWHAVIQTATKGRTSTSKDCQLEDVDQIREVLSKIDTGLLVKAITDGVVSWRKPLAVDFDWKSHVKANGTTLKATLERAKEIGVELGIGVGSKLSQIDDRVFTHLVEVVVDDAEPPTDSALASETSGPTAVVTAEDSPASDSDVKPPAHGGEGESGPAPIAQISHLTIHMSDGLQADISIEQFKDFVASAFIAGVK